MITILHGNDTAKSRLYYVEDKLKSQNPIVIFGKSINYDFLFQTLEGSQLFSNTQSIYIENFFSEIKPNTNEFKKIVEYINGKKETEILLWEEKELSKSQLAAFKNSKPILFNYPQLLFMFLDGIFPKNNKSIEILRELKQNMETDLIFFLIIRQFRFLLALLEQSNEQIDELKRLAPWQVSKFKRQLNFFKKEKLIDAYKKLYELDYKSKFGLLPYSLDRAIDIFLLDL